MIKGSCLCQQVEYQFDGQIEEVAICHCNQCKRAQGTPFVTNAPVSAEFFAFTKGKELVKEYFSSPNKKRVFVVTAAVHFIANVPICQRQSGYV